MATKLSRPSNEPQSGDDLGFVFDDAPSASAAVVPAAETSPPAVPQTGVPAESTTPAATPVAAAQNEQVQTASEPSAIPSFLRGLIKSRAALVLACLVVFGGGGAVVGSKFLHCNGGAGSGSPTDPDGGKEEILEKEIYVTVAIRVMRETRKLVIEPEGSGFSISVSEDSREPHGYAILGHSLVAYPQQVLITASSGKQYRPKEPIYALTNGKAEIATIKAVLVEPDAGQ